MENVREAVRRAESALRCDLRERGGSLRQLPHCKSEARDEDGFVDGLPVHLPEAQVKESPRDADVPDDVVDAYPLGGVGPYKSQRFAHDVSSGWNDTGRVSFNDAKALDARRDAFRHFALAHHAVENLGAKTSKPLMVGFDA